VSVRIIGRLDLKGPNLVKGINCEGLRVLGKPHRFAKLYYESGVDELLFVDVVASLFNRDSMLAIIERTAAEIFIPLTVGGGLRTLEDIREVLRHGADKVALNTAAVERPELIREAAETFGSSTIVLAIDAAPAAGGRHEALTRYGRQSTGLDALDWAKRGAELGAGEILITSIPREGLGMGFDLELVRAVAQSVPVPVIAGGGAANPGHIAKAVRQGGADAVALASMLHYNAARRFLDAPQDFDGEGNVEFLMGARGQISRFGQWDLPGLKLALRGEGLDVRLAAGAA
jgi:cyclase